MPSPLTTSLLTLLTLLEIHIVAVAPTSILDPSSTRPCSVRDPLMDPTYQESHGTYFVWQIPPNSKAVLFMGHGGDVDVDAPISFFDPAPKCEQCYGLPEHRALVLEALTRGYAVIVVRHDLHWYSTWPDEVANDLQIVTTILEEWISDHSELDGLPITAWGHSGGARIATALTTTMKLNALVLSCGALITEVGEAADPLRFPPTFFVYMPEDRFNPSLNITGKDAVAMAALSARGVEVAELAVCPKPISPLFFVERGIRCMSGRMSGEIFASLVAAGWVNDDGYLVNNPNVQEDWVSVLWMSNALPFCQVSGDLCLKMDVSQELKLAYAYHALSSDVAGVVFPWLDSKIQASGSAGVESVLQSHFLAAAIA